MERYGLGASVENEEEDSDEDDGNDENDDTWADFSAFRAEAGSLGDSSGAGADVGPSSVSLAEDATPNMMDSAFMGENLFAGMDNGDNKADDQVNLDG